MRVVCAFSWDDILPLAGPWHRWTEGRPLLGPGWCQLWWNRFGDLGQLYVLVVCDTDDRPVGLLPWYREVDPHRGRVIRFLGSTMTGSPCRSMLVEDRFEEPAAVAVAHWLVRNAADSQLGWDLLQLEPIHPADRRIAQLIDHLVEEGAVVQRGDRPGAHRVEMGSSWDQWLQRQTQEVGRKVVQVQQRYIATERARLHRALDAAAIADTIGHLQRLAAVDSPRDATHPPSHSSARPATMAGVLPQLVGAVGADSLRGWTVWVDQTLVAAQLDVRHQVDWYRWVRLTVPDGSGQPWDLLTSLLVAQAELAAGKTEQLALTGEVAGCRVDTAPLGTGSSLPQQILCASLVGGAVPSRGGVVLPVEPLRVWPKSGLDLTGMH